MLSVLCAWTARAATTNGNGLSCSTVAEALRRNKLGFGFSAGGLLFPYYIGDHDSSQLQLLGSVAACALECIEACMTAAVQASSTSSPSSRSLQVCIPLLHCLCNTDLDSPTIIISP